MVRAIGSYGNMTRNTFRGNGLHTWDASVMKDWKFSERVTGQFRAEVFNLLNRANFATPDISGGLFNIDGTRIPSATRITHTVTTSRQLQLGLKLVF